jgi:hypothetical protein
MSDDEIYAYCLERLDELQENIWELAKENGIPRTQEEADKIHKMIPFFLLSKGAIVKEK